MRTLKKSLALVLALVMVLGLGVVGASADNKLDDYNDLAKLDAQYVEAAGVLTGLGIVAGIDSVTLDPDGYYTREQAAKIITYLLLGETKAEALSCTEDPFDDVAADHWSAKYIAYCAERGIIDGVGGNKFDPYSKLTGYQWAKMLLSAVGFGKNGEFTGDSWSLGTATYAAITDLFEGDETGGDHVALRREQAMLYAFNALTNLGYVTYSEALGDYFWSYNVAVGDRVLPEGSLAWVIWNLRSEEGVVVDNEALGASATMLDTSLTSYSTADFSVNADTGLDVLGHLVRQWYTVSTTITGATVNTGVYTHDLATSTDYDCPANTVSSYATVLTANANTGWPVYEQSNVNNPDGVYDVTVKANAALATLTRFYEAADRTEITWKDGTSVTVDNDNIYTDISTLAKDTEVIVVPTWHGKYYIAPVTTTLGEVTGYNTTTKTATLADGTVLSISNLTDETDTIVVGESYRFTLDSHGHYIRFALVPDVVDVYYFTGAVQASTTSSILGEGTYAAEGVNVSTGAVQYFEIDIDDPKFRHTNDNHFYDAGYYNVNAAGTGGVTYAQMTTPTGDYTYTGTTIRHTLSGSNISGEVYYGDTVQFIFVSGAGRDLVRNMESVSVADLLADNNATSVTVNDAWFTAANNDYNNLQASAVFSAAEPNVAETTLGYVYLPENIDATDTWNVYKVSDTVYYYTYADAYINGVKTPITFLQTTNNAPSYNAGFYRYTMEQVTWQDGTVLNVVVLTGPVSTNNTTVRIEGSVTTGSTGYSIGGADEPVYLTWGNWVYDITNATVVDLRTGLYDEVTNPTGPDAINTISELQDRYDKSIHDFEDALDPVNIVFVTDLASTTNNGQTVNGAPVAIYILGVAD